MLKDPKHEEEVNKLREGMGFHYWFQVLQSNPNILR